MDARDERWKNHVRIFPDLKFRCRICWAQLHSGHVNMAYLKKFIFQQDDTSDCDIQETETILHQLEDCPHHTEERRPLCVAPGNPSLQLCSSGFNAQLSTDSFINHECSRQEDSRRPENFFNVLL